MTKINTWQFLLSANKTKYLITEELPLITNILNWLGLIIQQLHPIVLVTDSIILNVPQYQPSIYKSTKQFGLSFAYDAPKIWNELPDNVSSATSIASFRKKLKAYLFCQAYPP